MISLVQSRFFYVMKLHWLQFLYILKIFSFFFRNSKTSYQLWNVKSPESLHTFENPYSTCEKRVWEFLSCKIVLYSFFCYPSVCWPGPTQNHPPSATAEMRCEIFNLVYPVATPSSKPLPLSEPLPFDSRSSVHPFPIPLSSHPRWLDS